MYMCKIYVCTKILTKQILSNLRAKIISLVETPEIPWEMMLHRIWVWVFYLHILALRCSGGTQGRLSTTFDEVSNDHHDSTDRVKGFFPSSWFQDDSNCLFAFQSMSGWSCLWMSGSFKFIFQYFFEHSRLNFLFSPNHELPGGGRRPGDGVPGRPAFRSAPIPTPLWRTWGLPVPDDDVTPEVTAPTSEHTSASILDMLRRTRARSPPSREHSHLDTPASTSFTSSSLLF